MVIDAYAPEMCDTVVGGRCAQRASCQMYERSPGYKQ